MALLSRRRFFAVCGTIAVASSADAATTGGVTLRSGSFVVRAPGASAAELQQYVRSAGLEELERELGRVLNLAAAPTPIETIIYPSRQSHRAAISRLQVDAPHRRALYVRDRGAAVILAYRQDELPLDLRHEGTHALLHANLPMTPLWLDEGLASYFQEPPGLRASGGAHHQKLINDLRFGQMVSISELETRAELRDMSLRDYRYAWGWVHYMLHGPPGGARVLWKTLDDIRRRQPPQPISAALAEQGPTPESAMRRHFLHDWPRAIELARRQQASR